STPPSVSLTQPANGSTVSGSVGLAATASDNVGVTKVEFLVDGGVVATDNTAPYSATWNSTSVPNGAVEITARAHDAADNSTDGSAVTVNVNNGGSPPTNLITNPSLESDANNDGVADCWQRAGFGTNSFVWTRTTD